MLPANFHDFLPSRPLGIVLGAEEDEIIGYRRTLSHIPVARRVWNDEVGIDDWLFISLEPKWRQLQAQSKWQ
jgi:hypothetical protein